MADIRIPSFGNGGKPSSLTNGNITAYFDAMVEKQFNFEADVPEYPTEKGFQVSESVQRRTYELAVTAFLTNSPVSNRKEIAKVSKGQTDKVQNTISSLIALYNSGNRLTFTSAGVEYPSVVLKSLGIPRTGEMQAAAEITMILKQVRTVKLKAATVSDDVDQTSETVKQGETETSNIVSGFMRGDSSILRSIFDYCEENQINLSEIFSNLFGQGNNN